VSVGWPTTVGTWTSVPVDTWSDVGISETPGWVEGPSGSFASGDGAVRMSEYWYYCTNPAGYFPHVQQCGSAWIPVIPQAPSAAGTPPQVAPMRSPPPRVGPAPLSTMPAQ
jgi:hypothetical protein